MIRASRLLVLPVVVALAATLAACGTAGSPGPTTPSPGGSPTPAASASDDASPEPTPITSPPCTRESLENLYSFVDNSGGAQHGLLSVRNRTDAPCSLSGYPTLYFGYPEIAVSMGAAAEHDANDPGTPLDLAPGAEAVARITITDAASVAGCEPLETDSMVWSPPGAEFDVEVTAQHVYVTAMPGCSTDVVQLKVGGFNPA